MLLKRLLYILILFVSSSCEDEIDVPLPKPLVYKYVVHQNALPVLEFLFTQRLGESTGENLSTLKIRNISNSDINNLRFVISVFKSLEKTIENYEYIYTSSIQSNILRGDTSNSFTISNSSSLILKDGLVEIGVLSTGTGNKFSGTYQGDFTAFSSTDPTPENLITYNVTSGYIESDGFVNFKIAGKTLIKSIQGYINKEGSFYGQTLNASGTIVNKATSVEKVELIDGVLMLKLHLQENTNNDNMKYIIFSMLNK